MSKSNGALTFVGRVARQSGWQLNPNAEELGSVVAGLDGNHERYGYYLCPCREGAGIREKDQDVICPCRYCVDDIEEYGHCFCGIFVSPALVRSGAVFEPIPERRPVDLAP